MPYGDFFGFNEQYYYYYEDFLAGRAVLALLLLPLFIIAVFELLSLASRVLSFLSYLFEAVSKLLAAKKLGVKIGWFAFFPILKSFLHGKLADAADQRRTNGKRRARWSVLMLVLDLVGRALLGIVSFASAVTWGLLAFTVELLDSSYVVFGEAMGYSLDSAMLAAFVSVGVFGLSMVACLVYGAFSLLNQGFVNYVVRLVKMIVNFKVYRAFAGKQALWMIAADFFTSGDASGIFYAVFGFSSLFDLPSAEQEALVSAKNADDGEITA